MGKVLRYLLQNFTLTFLSLFGTLFFVISIIFFIKISSITAIVKIDFAELGKLYLFMLPRILLFTLPLSFFIALALSLFRLSKENESIVLFTLGYNPLYIAKFFTLLAFLLSIFLLLNSLFIVPLADQLNTNFLDFKKNEAQFNISPSESGQSFSNWFLIAGSIEDKNGSRNYHNIALYSPANKESEHFVLSKSAKIALK